MNFFHAVNASGSTIPRLIQTGLLYRYDPALYSGSGTNYPDAQGNKDLTLSGGPTYNASVPCFFYDGVNDAASCSAFNLPITGSATLGAYFTLSSTSGIRLIYAHWQPLGFRGLAIYWNGNVNRFFVRVEDDAGNFGTSAYTYTPSLGTWYYVVLSWDYSTRNLTLSFYASGGLVATDTNTYSTVNNSGGFTAIQTKIADNFYLHGNVGETHTYNRLLSASEINQNFNTTRARYGL